MPRESGYVLKTKMKKCIYMVFHVNLKLSQEELERLNISFYFGGSAFFDSTIEEGNTKYPVIGYMTNNETVVNTLKNGIKYIDYYLDEIKYFVLDIYLPMLHYILCDENANCIGVDYTLNKNLLELISISDKIGYLIALKYLGTSKDGSELIFENGFMKLLENTEESRNKAKEILEKLKNISEEDIKKAYDIYSKLKWQDARYHKFFRKILSALNVDGVNLVAVEPYIHRRYLDEVMQD